MLLTVVLPDATWVHVVEMSIPINNILHKNNNNNK